MRGRDSGTKPYRDLLDSCNLNQTYIRRFNHLSPFFTEDNLKLLKKLYERVEDVDALVGMLLEKPTNGILGPVATCIISKQFYNSKYGDRFFYTHQSNPYAFTTGKDILSRFSDIWLLIQNKFSFNTDQLREIESVTFANFLCWITDVSEVPDESFLAPSQRNIMMNCNKTKPLNFDLFK